MSPFVSMRNGMPPPQSTAERQVQSVIPLWEAAGTQRLNPPSAPATPAAAQNGRSSRNGPVTPVAVHAHPDRRMRRALSPVGAADGPSEHVDMWTHFKRPLPGNSDSRGSRAVRERVDGAVLLRSM